MPALMSPFCCPASLDDVLTSPHVHYRSADEWMMARCIQLAERARGYTSPNPLVGAVVLNSAGKVVGEGWHQRAGDSHAEPLALAQAGCQARGGTLYVTLEPCHHTGRTPPCTQAIVEAGIGRVVFGCADLNPHVSGHGGDALKQRGIQVDKGVLSFACQEQNEAFFRAIQHQSPFVTVKLALTADGHVNIRSPKGVWLTSPLSKQWAHQLRAQQDVVLTTAESILADDSRLTVREGLQRAPQPIRVVLDRRGRLRDYSAQVFDTQCPDGSPAPVIHVLSQSLQPTWPKEYSEEENAIETWFVPEWGNGLCLETVLKRLYAKHQALSVLVEAGPRLVSRFINEQRVHKIKLVYTPHWVMDSGATPASTGQVQLQLNSVPTLQITHRQTIGPDTWVTAIPQYPQQQPS